MTEWQIQIKEYETINIMNKWDLKKIKSSDKFPVEYKYKKGENSRGYTNPTLSINLSTGEIKENIVTANHEFAENAGMGFIFSSRKDDKEFNFLDKFDYLLSKLMVTHGIGN